MIIALVISFISIAVAALIFEKKGLGTKIKTGAHWYVICGLANGLVNLFVIMLAKYDASIVFPVISAGGIVTSALAGIFIYKEKLSAMQILGMILGTSSIVFLNL
jgi:multidrug transporter EmrE-like cation transporter